MSVPYWIIEASLNGVVYDDHLYYQGSRADAEGLAKELEAKLDWHDFTKFIVRPEPLTQAEMAERILS